MLFGTSDLPAPTELLIVRDGRLNARALTLRSRADMHLSRVSALDGVALDAVNRTQEVRGSNPLSSTESAPVLAIVQAVFAQFPEKCVERYSVRPDTPSRVGSRRCT